MNCQQLLSELIRITGYSLSEISSASGIPLANLSHIKRGKVKIPQHTTYQKLFGFYCRVAHSNNA